MKMDLSDHCLLIICLLLSSFTKLAIAHVHHQYPMRSPASSSLLTAQLFHGEHVPDVPDEDDDDESWTYNENDNEERKDKDESRPNDTRPRHSSHHRPNNDVQEDERRRRDRDDRHHGNHFLVHRSRKQMKPNAHEKHGDGEHFVWHPFAPPFLGPNNSEYVPFFPFTMSTWLRKPNDILLVVLQEQQRSSSSETASTPTTNTSTTPCTCPDQSHNRTSAASASLTQNNDLEGTRNKSTASDDSHSAQWPSSCIWAIVACCAPNNYHFRYGCFHYLSCTVAFWHTETCQLPIILSAAKEALSYYEQFNAGSTLPTQPPSRTDQPSTTTESGTASATVTPAATTTTTVAPQSTTTSVTTTSVATTSVATTQAQASDIDTTTVIEPPTQTASR